LAVAAFHLGDRVVGTVTNAHLLHRWQGEADVHPLLRRPPSSFAVGPRPRNLLRLGLSQERSCAAIEREIAGSTRSSS
jgi:hypothetical protein